jgi:glyoxylase-like metal-dependent hydrolase (beta-lactamase superfamily II)
MLTSPMAGSDLSVDPPEHSPSPLTGSGLPIDLRTAASPSGSAPNVGPIDHVVTSGTFSLDGGTWEVDNNVWLVGDEHEVIVIDAAHDLEKIAFGIGGRRVVAILCTHAHDDHVNQAPALSDRFDAPVYLHPAEAPLWAMAHPDRKPDHDLCDGDVLTAGGIDLHAITTQGHSPGSSRLYVPDLATVFTGDTPVPGRAGSDGAVVLVVRHDHRLDPHPAAHAARRHRRADGTRRPEVNRGGGTAP